MANDRCIGGGMAYFFRLISVLFSLLLTGQQAHSQEYFDYTSLSCAVPGTSLSQWGSEKLAVINADPAWVGATWYDPPHFQLYSGVQCVGTIAMMLYGTPNGYQGKSDMAVCPDSSWTVDSVEFRCKRARSTPPECVSPEVLVNGVCQLPEPPKCSYPPGSPMPDTLFQMGGGANYKGGYICYLNCEAVPNMRAQKGGNWFHWGPYTSTGATCATGAGDATGGQPTPNNPDGVPPPSDPDAPPRDPPPPPPEPAPTPCKKGTCPGTINGIMVCMPCEEIRSGQPTPGAPPKAPPTPPDPTGNNAPPDTQNTTQSATNCKDGKCTTTTTKSTTDAGGVTTTSSHTKTESQDDFCTTNPRSSMCIDGVFGGACSGGFACEGDAVQCAIAKEQHVRNCKLFEDFDSEEAQLYQTEKGKEGSVLGSLEGNITKTIGASDFDTSDALGAGATCIANKSITVMGTSILIPFSDICPYLAILGNILMSVSFLLAGRIVMRG